MAGVKVSSIFGTGATQIDRSILENVFKAAHATGVPGMSVGVKTAIRNRIGNSRNKTGAGIGETNSVLDQFTKFGGKVPRQGTIGPQPTQGGKDFINASTDYADDVKTGDSDTFLPTRVGKRTVGSRFVADTRPPGLTRIQSDLAFLRRNPKAVDRSGPYGGMR